MKNLIVLLALAAPLPVFAQTAPGAKPTPVPTSQQAATAFSVRQPDEGSPFFSEREAAKYLMSQRGQMLSKDDAVAVYPRVKNSPDSATSMFTRFFTEMFSSVNLAGLRGDPTSEKLLVDPPQFSLQERREFETVYTVRNNTGKIIRLDYPTSQRIDILTTAPSGQVIDRWSDDRAFQQREGIVIINPRERIEYREKIPTRDMKPDQTYSIQAEITGYPEYNATRTVVPTP